MKYWVMLMVVLWASAAGAEDGFKESTPQKPACTIDVRQDFLQFDHNLDNKVTLEEIQETPYYVEVTEQEKEEIKDMRYQLFHMLDKNDDDYVSEDELREHTKKLMPDCIVE